MRILICGGRDFKDNKFLYSWLNNRFIESPSFVITGDADGADMLALNWAEDREINWRSFRADWVKHGKAAGPIRNQLMLDEGKPDLVIAFPGGHGTADMVKRAKKAGVKVVEVKYERSDQA